MAFLGVKELNNLQKSKRIIEPFDSNRLKNGSYELSLGSEVYLTDSKTSRVELLNNDSNRQVDLNPGQFALLLTKEKVHVPKSNIAFISIKAGEKLKGLVNVSGFHVDPGFHDHLLFSVYNAGPSTIVLNFDEPYFLIWFAEMKTELEDNEAYNHYNDHFGKLEHIPPKYIEFLKRGELTSPKALLDKIRKVDDEFKERNIKLDERVERNEWLLKIIIGILTTICLKLIWDGVSYDRGYNDGKGYRTISEQIRQEIHTLPLDSVISYKIDSILNSQMRYDTTQ